MSGYDSNIWVVSDDELWVVSDNDIWIPIILRGVITFVSIKEKYLIESENKIYIFVSNPSEDEHEFTSNISDRLFVSYPSEDEHEFISNNNDHLFVSYPNEDEHEFNSNNINSTFVSKPINKIRESISSDNTYQ